MKRFVDILNSFTATLILHYGVIAVRAMLSNGVATVVPEHDILYTHCEGA